MIVSYHVHNYIFSSSDIDECALGTHDCNVSNQFCVNVNGSYICPCLSGFEESGTICIGMR